MWFHTIQNVLDDKYPSHIIGPNRSQGKGLKWKKRNFRCVCFVGIMNYDRMLQNVKKWMGGSHCQCTPDNHLFLSLYLSLSQESDLNIPSHKFDPQSTRQKAVSLECKNYFRSDNKYLSIERRSSELFAVGDPKKIMIIIIIKWFQSFHVSFQRARLTSKYSDTFSTIKSPRGRTKVEEGFGRIG